jgi:AraC family transcriptional regulator, regulatory protein of adaptative response / methylated-DNA-[protein]-cysteine methyltransferase
MIFKDKEDTHSKFSSVITITEIATPLGPMFAGATGEGVCLLEFTNRIRFEKEMKDLKQALQAETQSGRNAHLNQLEKELNEYFEGKRKVFSIALHTPGTEFEKAVWTKLQEIPYGRTWSYKEQSMAMNNPKAIRAIAATNGRNRIAIVIPCHRVIGSNGTMTGYAAGVEKKKWLLNFERSHSDTPVGEFQF